VAYTLPDPNADKKKKKPVKKVEQAAVQGTGPQAFNAAGKTGSYITSFPVGAKEPVTKTEEQLSKQLYGMSTAERVAYATKLKAAGYSVGPINGAVTKNLRQAWLNAHYDLDTEAKAAIAAGVQSGSSSDLDSFLTANAGTGGTGAGKAGSTIATSQINDTSAAGLIKTIFRDLADQEPTPQEIAKYTAALRKAQMANPTKTVYDGTGKSMTTGGIDTQQFITQQIEATPEAKTNRATDAYSVMMEELGGLR
jgi:hypothetical protein